MYLILWDNILIWGDRGLFYEVLQRGGQLLDHDADGLTDDCFHDGESVGFRCVCSTPLANIDIFGSFTTDGQEETSTFLVATVIGPGTEVINETTTRTSSGKKKTIIIVGAALGGV
jgi:hypothetical protein